MQDGQRHRHAPRSGVSGARQRVSCGGRLTRTWLSKTSDFFGAIMYIINVLQCEQFYVIDTLDCHL